MLLCDFHRVVGAKIIVEHVDRVKVKYFDPSKGEVIMWINKSHVSKIYRYVS